MLLQGFRKGTKTKKEEMTMFGFKKKYYVSIALFFSFIFLISSCGGSGGNNDPSDTFLLSGQINGPVQEGITIQVREGNTTISTTVTDKNGQYSMHYKGSVSDAYVGLRASKQHCSWDLHYVKNFTAEVQVFNFELYQYDTR